MEEKKMIEELKSSLLDFVKRVSKGDTISEAESAALPEVVKELKELLIYD